MFLYLRNTLFFVLQCNFRTTFKALSLLNIIPMALQLSYLLLTAFVLILLYFIGARAINHSETKPKKRSKYKAILLGGLVLWQAYIYLMTQTGIFLDFAFPPKFALFLIFPLFLFSGVFIFKNRKKEWISSIPSHWLIFFQSFRILVEIIFVYSVAAGILNKEASIEGYNYDMILGISAPIVGLLFYKNIIGKNIVKLWNYLGLAILVSVIFVFMSSLYNPQLFGSETILLPKEAVHYPYVLVAGFLMPVAVFIHLLSLAQLSNKVA